MFDLSTGMAGAKPIMGQTHRDGMYIHLVIFVRMILIKVALQILILFLQLYSVTISFGGAILIVTFVLFGGGNATCVEIVVGAIGIKALQDCC